MFILSGAELASIHQHWRAGLVLYTILHDFIHNWEYTHDYYQTFALISIYILLINDDFKLSYSPFNVASVCVDRTVILIRFCNS